MHKNGVKKGVHIRSRIYKWGPQHTATYSKYNHKLLGALIRKGDKLGGYKKVQQLSSWMKTTHFIEPYKLLFFAYLKLSPVLQPRYIKVAGKMQPVAYGLMNEDKRVTFGIKWTIKLLRDKHNTRGIDIHKLGQGLYEATCNTGELLAHKQSWQRNLLRNSRKMPTQLRRLRTSRIQIG